jgi:dTDP-4-amino-4,6-dideoxygalactose transaminase
MKKGTKLIYLSSPHMGGEEMKYINEAFDQNWIAPLGPNVDKFEQEIEQYLGVKHAAALSSGTAAIHLALIILGVEPGDEVLASSFTFSATVNPIVYQKATPILVDSEPNTWNMSPSLLESAIKDRIKKGKRPKAIIAVHLYGMPANIEKILEIGNKYEIPVIEDAAEALGSKFKGKSAGTFGDMGILSFNGNKIITTSGGGALVSDNEVNTTRARFLATQARDNAFYYQHTQIGYNYKLSNVSAGIGRGQMKVLDQRVLQRRQNYSFYYNNLHDFPGITFLEEPCNAYFSNRWLTTIIVDPDKTGLTPGKFQGIFEKENIQVRPLWKPMHMQPVFSSCPAYLNGTSEDLFSKGLCLPSGSNMSDEDRERVLRVLKKVFDK